MTVYRLLAKMIYVASRKTRQSVDISTNLSQVLKPKEMDVFRNKCLVAQWPGLGFESYNITTLGDIIRYLKSKGALREAQ